jgi:hypothetical protein
VKVPIKTLFAVLDVCVRRVCEPVFGIWSSVPFVGPVVVVESKKSTRPVETPEIP